MLPHALGVLALRQQIRRRHLKINRHQAEDVPRPHPRFEFNDGQVHQRRASERAGDGDVISLVIPSDWEQIRNHPHERFHRPRKHRHDAVSLHLLRGELQVLLRVRQRRRADELHERALESERDGEYEHQKISSVRRAKRAQQRRGITDAARRARRRRRFRVVVFTALARRRHDDRARRARPDVAM